MQHPSFTEDLFSATTAPPEDAKGFHIGTSGFSFADWSGAFYPPKLPRDRWLAYYARHFRVVEINATYYRIPTAATFETMAKRTPVWFGFWVKVPGTVTHSGDDINSAMTAFRASVNPLADADKLRGFLAQFPPAFTPGSQAYDRIKALADLCGDTPLVIEFRRQEWLTEETFALLEDRRIILAAVDLPPLPGLPAGEVHPSSRLNYVRFHGRNARTWNNRGAGDRYDWDYHEDELRGWLPRLKQLGTTAEITNIFFNNCHAAQAVKSARMLRDLLQRELATSQ